MRTKLNKSSERSLSVMKLRSQRISEHIEQVKKKNEDHQEEVLREQLGTFERSLQKVKRMKENNEFREQQIKLLIDLKRTKMDQKYDNVKRKLTELFSVQKEKKKEILK